MSVDSSPRDANPFRICFVCTGNICRSPMAEVVFRDLIRARGWQNSVIVQSAGTGEWHVGEPSDSRTADALRQRGYPDGTHRARQFDVDWFDSLDLVIAFDRGQERILKTWAPSDDARAKVHLLTSFDPEAAGIDVPDPYYSDAAMFDSVLSMIERACRALLSQLEPGLRQGAR